MMGNATILYIKVHESKLANMAEKHRYRRPEIQYRRKTANKNLFMEYEDVFSQNENDLGHCGLISYSIELIGEIPKRCGVRPLNPAMKEVLKTQLDELQRNDLKQLSRSEYECPVVMVKKKEGSLRFCCDFRRLNDVTRRDSYPLPRISEVISTLEGAKVFSTLDLKSGDHQILMNPKDSFKTDFSTQ